MNYLYHSNLKVCKLLMYSIKKLKLTFIECMMQRTEQILVLKFISVQYTY